MPAPKRSALIAVVVILVLALILFLGASASPPPPTCGVCKDDTPICDTATGQCVACAGDSECLSGTLCNESGACTHCRRPSVGCTGELYCREDGSECVECSPGVNSDCNDNLDGPLCSDIATCVNCRGNGDCQNNALPGYSASTRYCDTVKNACVGCLGLGDCANGQLCVDGVCAICDPSISTSCGSGYCVVGGDGALACAPCVEGVEGVGAKPCATSGNLCVPDGHGSSTCVECVSGGAPCSPGNTCQGGKCTQACTDLNPCEDPDLLNCVEGVCVGCSDGGPGEISTDCETAYPGTPFRYCESGLCVQCSINDGTQTGCDDPEAPHCYKNTCQQCSPTTGYEDCVDNDGGPFCQLVSLPNASDSYQCVECTSDGACIARTDGRTICDVTGDFPTYKCVGCNGANLCSGGKSCIEGQCAVCGVGMPCPGGDGTHCSDGQCVECSQPGDCDKYSSGHLCNQSGQCVKCLDAGDCPGVGDSAELAHCLADGRACVECTGDTDCMADPNRFCDPATNTCVACSDEHICAGGKSCIGGQCAECKLNCDCEDIDHRYCKYNVCRDITLQGDGCWGWSSWDSKSSSVAPWDTMGNPNYVAVIAQKAYNTPWYVGRTPRSPGGYNGLPFKTMEGNQVGDTGSGYTAKFVPWDGVFWYMYSREGCGHPSQLMAGDTTPVMFNGPNGNWPNTIDVCATQSGELLWSAPSAYANAGVCGQPTGMGAFNKMGLVPRGLNDCPSSS